jgi:hypothetical protein
MTITWLRERAINHAITTISKLKQFIPHDGIVRPAITYDESGGNLPSEIDGRRLAWRDPPGYADMERDLHETGVHITETRTKPRGNLGRKSR